MLAYYLLSVAGRSRHPFRMLESTLGYWDPASADWRICRTSFEPRQRAGDRALSRRAWRRHRPISSAWLVDCRQPVEVFGDPGRLPPGAVNPQASHDLLPVEPSFEPMAAVGDARGVTCGMRRRLPNSHRTT